MTTDRGGPSGPHERPSVEASPIDAPAGYPGRPLRVSGLLTGTGFTEQQNPVTHGRRPVLAIGSNADPAQLRRKLGSSLHVPVTAIRVNGLAVAHSAHVGPPGYVPYAPRRAPGARLDAVLLWLDDAALAALDATEPNYRRIRVPGVDFQVYRSRWGLLPAAPGHGPLPAGDQAGAYRCLAARPWFAGLVPELRPESATGPGLGRESGRDRQWMAAITALRADPDRREQVRARLAAERAVPDGWG